MNSQHTPGPWLVDQAMERNQATGETTVLHIAVRAGDYGTFIADVDKESDARLIAAAPDLLAALRKVEQLITRDSDDLGFHLQMAAIAVEDAQALRAAIAKAEGE